MKWTGEQTGFLDRQGRPWPTTRFVVVTSWPRCSRYLVIPRLRMAWARMWASVWARRPRDVVRLSGRDQSEHALRTE